MMREIIWKEWRENRWKYVSLWLVFNAPILILSLFLALSHTARAPFEDLTNRTVMKYLPLAIGESYLVITIFLLATALVAVATFLPELQHSIFFVFEQPLSRRRYAGIKLLNGAGHVALAACAAVLLAPAAAYGWMLAGGKITVAGSGAAFGAVMAAAARALPICCVLSLAAFTGSALIAVLLRRWWLAVGGAALFAILFERFAFLGLDDFFDMMAPGKSMSVSVNSGTPKWLNVTDTFPMPTQFAPWHSTTALVSIALIAVFSIGLAVIYDRKELQ
jgi:hypothetical protein